MTDEELIADWYQRRGTGEPKLKPVEEKAMIERLREHQEELAKPLRPCPECGGFRARGPHRARLLPADR